MALELGVVLQQRLKITGCRAACAPEKQRICRAASCDLLNIGAKIGTSTDKRGKRRGGGAAAPGFFNGDSARIRQRLEYIYQSSIGAVIMLLVINSRPASSFSLGGENVQTAILGDGSVRIRRLRIIERPYRIL